MKLFLTSLLSALVIVSGTCSKPHESGAPGQKVVSHQEAWDGLLSLENKDLQQVDSQDIQELLSYWQRSTPEVKKRPPYHIFDPVPPFYDPRYLWKVENPNEPARYVLIGAIGPFEIPGDSRAEGYVFDLQGNRLSYTEFSLGGRANFEGVSLVRNDEIDLPLIKFSTNRVDLGSGQYYALIGDSLSLIRLEGEVTALRNQFVADNWTMGPRVPERTPEEWESSLRSNNPAEVLWALTWIGGKRWDLKIPTQVGSDGYTEPMPDVRKNSESVVSVCQRPGVQQRLKELRGSGSKWMMEAAELALHPHDGDT